MKMKNYLFIFLLFCNTAFAQTFAQCKGMFADGKPAQVVNHKPTAELCYNSFAVLYSGETKTPLYVAERLNRASVIAKVRRTNRFHPEPRLPKQYRAELEAYSSSGYDKGHMAPAANMPNGIAMQESFSLANIVPQAKENNRKPWKQIEESVRKYAIRTNRDLYVVTGAYFSPSKRFLKGSGVQIPRHLFKAVYDPVKGKSWAYWIENTDGAKIPAPISLLDLESKLGYNPIPSTIKK